MTAVQIVILLLNLIALGFSLATLFIISDMNDGICRRIKQYFRLDR